MGGVFEIFDVLYKVLPAWMVVALFSIVVIAILPSWYRWVRNKKIKGILRNMASTSETDTKEALWETLWHRVGQNAALLNTTALAAQEMGLSRARLEAESRLVGLGQPIPPYPIKEPKPEGPGHLHPIEVAARVQQLLGQGLTDAAQNLVDSCRARYPNDPDLDAAQEAIRDHTIASATMPPGHNPSDTHEP